VTTHFFFWIPSAQELPPPEKATPSNPQKCSKGPSVAPPPGRGSEINSSALSKINVVDGRKKEGVTECALRPQAFEL